MSNDFSLVSDGTSATLPGTSGARHDRMSLHGGSYPNYDSNWRHSNSSSPYAYSSVSSPRQERSSHRVRPASIGAPLMTSTTNSDGLSNDWQSTYQRNGSPPRSAGSTGSTGSTGSSSTDSYEDYFCRSPSPNNFFLNGKNKNETDELKVILTVNKE